MFSMCSELTPRAHVPDNRIPQLMQPCGCPCLPCWFIGKQIHIYINIKYLISTLRPASWIFHTPTTITDFDFEQDLQMSWIVATILKSIYRLSDSQKCAPKCSQNKTTLNCSYYTVYTGVDVAGHSLILKFVSFVFVSFVFVSICVSQQIPVRRNMNNAAGQFSTIHGR